MHHISQICLGLKKWMLSNPSQTLVEQFWSIRLDTLKGLQLFDQTPPGLLSHPACVSKYSAGSVFYYPSFHHVHNAPQREKFQKDLERYLTRKIGFEAVMRIRCTKGKHTRTPTKVNTHALTHTHTSKATVAMI